MRDTDLCCPRRYGRLEPAQLRHREPNLGRGRGGLIFVVWKDVRLYLLLLLPPHRHFVLRPVGAVLERLSIRVPIQSDG